MDLKEKISKAWDTYKSTRFINTERNRFSERVYELPDCDGFYFDLTGYSVFPSAYYPKAIELTPASVGFRQTPRTSIHISDTGFFQRYDDADPKELKEYFYYTVCKDEKKLKELLKRAEDANTKSFCSTGIAESGKMDLQKVSDACRETIIFSSFCLDFYALYECYEPLLTTNEPSLPFVEMRTAVNSLMMPLTTDVFSAFFKGMIGLADSYLYDTRNTFERKVDYFLEKEGVILYTDLIADSKSLRNHVIDLTKRYTKTFPDIKAIYTVSQDILHNERLNRCNYWKARQKLESYYPDNPEMKMTVKNLLEFNTYAIQYNDEARRRRSTLFRLMSRPDVREFEQEIAERIREEDYVKALSKPLPNS